MVVPHLSNLYSDTLAITTVGYGEITPRSFLGRLFTLPLLVFGLLLIALPSFVLGREFSLVWEKMTSDQVSFRHNFPRAVAYIGYIPENDTFGRPDSPTISPSDAHPIRTHDLSNFKLAQNQTELSKQIEELKATVELNVQIMNRLLEALEGRKKQDQEGSN
jgi:potassium voltage-gated channel Shal-related subfamily D member 2